MVPEGLSRRANKAKDHLAGSSHFKVTDYQVY